MEEQKLSFPNRHRLNNNIWAKTLLWNFRIQLRRASLVAVPQVRAKLGTAPLKQVRRAVSLHLHPPLPRLAKLSPGCFPITGGRGERGVEGSPEVPPFWGESEWLVPLPWLGVLVELAWFGTREPAETGVALRSGPGAPGGFILGREEKSGCLVSQLSEWPHKRLVCVSPDLGCWWGSWYTLDAWGPMRKKDSGVTCCCSTKEPAVLQTDTRGRSWAPEKESATL